MPFSVVNKRNARIFDPVNRAVQFVGFEGLKPLFSAGQLGHWPDGYNPALGRLFQDAAGTTPVTAPGQPVGLVKRAAGTADASQAIALSRPTLGRWPKGGRRNMLNYSEQFDNAAWAKQKSTVAGTKLIETAESGIHRIYQIAYKSASAISVTAFAEISAAERSFATIRLAGAGETGAASFGVDLITGAMSANSMWNGFTNLQKSAVNVGGGRWLVTISATTDSTNMVLLILGLATTLASSDVYLGDGSSGINIHRTQMEIGATATPYQRVTTSFDITEAGVPSVSHLYNDGGDSLPVTLPAGTYGRARVNTEGQVTVDTVVDPTDALSGTRQVDVILRQGAFSAAEEAQIRAYWARYAA